MSKQHSLLKIIIVILAAIGLIWFAIPIFYGVINIGSAVAMVFCLLVLIGAAFYSSIKAKYKKFQNRKRAKVILIVFTALVGAGVLGVIVLTGCMIFGANAAPPQDATVVVLGSQVKGTEPSLDLMQRINAATDYLKANPQAKL